MMAEYRIVALNKDAVAVEQRSGDQWSQVITFSGLFPHRAAEQWINQRKRNT